jgi:alkyl sulfatase BDS1-like metallo-beta-lactamase superfamily hydrolase
MLEDRLEAFRANRRELERSVLPLATSIDGRRCIPIVNLSNEQLFDALAIDPNEVVAGSATPEELMASGRLAVEGDQAKLGELLGLLDPPDPGFAIVTP